MPGRSFLLVVPLFGVGFEFFEGRLHSFPHKELDKLILADMAISIDIDFAEDITDGLLRLLPFQELSDLLVADIPTVIDIEVFKGSLVVLSLEIALGVQGSDKKLCVFDLARPVEINQSQHHRQSIIISDAPLHDFLELGRGNSPI